jgi:L-iditol 2-dehydrogenase
MKALRKVKEGYGNLELVDIPVPSIGSDDVLIKIWACGICGTDLHIRRDEYKVYKAPQTIGHEFSGIVEKVGKNVKNVKPGDEVVSDLETPEGIVGVSNGVDGGHAEYLAVPSNQIHKLPKNVSLKEAVLSEPVVCTTYSIMERTKIRPGDFVAIIGPGPIGLLMSEVVRLYSPKAVLVTGLRGKDEFRLNVAKKMNIDYVLYNDDNVVDRVKDLTSGIGADVVIEASGSDEGTNQALNMVKMGGQINTFAVYDNHLVKADLSQIPWKCLTIASSWGWEGYEHEATRTTAGTISWERGLEIMNLKKLNLEPLITHEFPLEKWEEAFEICEEKKGLKVMLKP